MGTYRLERTNPMNVEYCRGLAAGLDRTVGAGEVRSRLMDLRRLEDRVAEGYLITNIFPEFSSRSPVILVGPMAPSSPWVSTVSLGEPWPSPWTGHLGILAGMETWIGRGPMAFWISIREE